MLAKADQQVSVELLVARLEVEADFPRLTPGHTGQFVVEPSFTKVELDEPVPRLVHLDFLQVRRQVGNHHLG